MHRITEIKNTSQRSVRWLMGCLSLTPLLAFSEPEMNHEHIVYSSTPTLTRESELAKDAPQLEKAKRVLADRVGGLAANASLFAVRSHSFPLSQTTALEYEFLISKDRQETVVIDPAGAQVDLVSLAEIEQRLFYDRYGRMSNQLAERLDSAQSNERIGVVIWIKDSQNAPRLRVNENANLSEADEAIGRHRESTRIRLALVGMEEERQIRTLDVNAKRDALFPAITARLTPNQIRAFARFPNVGGIYSTEIELVPTMIYRDNTRFIDVVKKRRNSSSALIMGQGAHITAIEADGGNLGNQYCQTPTGNLSTLKPCSQALWYPSGSTSTTSNIEQDPNGCTVSDHATSVVGIMAASPLNMEGFAPKAKIWVTGPCRGETNTYPIVTSKAATAVTDKKTNIINISFASTSPGSGLDAFDVYFDRLSFNYNTTVVVAAGNTSNATYVSSPGKAHNVITVGAVDDRGTVNTTDAVMYSFSNAGDPVTGVIKPEVVAPGGMYVPTTQKQSTCFYDPSIPVSDQGCLWYRWKVGTSLAAPTVSSIAALIMTRNAALKAYPEVVKAIIIASASEQPAGLGLNFGTGAVLADIADDIAAKNKGNWINIDDFCSKYPIGTSFVTTIGNFPPNTDFHAAISRGVNPDGDPNYQAFVQYDFTLKVLPSNGRYVQPFRPGRRSWYGLMHMRNLETADVRLEILNNSCSAPNIPMGVALRYWMPADSLHKPIS